jgi:hypothetical protein
VLPDGGAGLAALLQTLCEGLDPQMAEHAAFIGQVTELGQLTSALTGAAKLNAELVYWVADDYLRAVALTLMAWAWLQINRAVSADAAPHGARWTEPASAVRHWVLPEFDMRLAIIRARVGEGA